MRWLLLGLFALNLLQATYIFTLQSSHIISETLDSNSLKSSSNHLTGTENTFDTKHTKSKPLLSSGVSLLTREVRLVSRTRVNELIESGKGLETVRFALWPKGGFLATYVKQASIIAHLGLMKGDVVKAINNTKMNSVLHALSIYQDLEDLHVLELSIERQGKTISYFYKLID